MKLNKDNCLATCYEFYSGNTASLEAKTWDSSFPKARVIEVPKVWRENGKQYKVDFVTISAGSISALEGVDFVVKAPRGCRVNCPYASEIEYYD